MGMVMNSYLTPVPPAEFEVDAGLSISYSGSGAWNNITTFPASGASQSAYNLALDGTLGSTDYPVFNGVAGGNSANEFFADSTTNGNGRSYFDLAANSTFINTLHKSTALFTWYGFISFPVMDTTILNTINTTATDIGISLTVVTQNVAFKVGNGTAQATVHTSSTIPFSPARKLFLALSYKASTGAGIMYSNGAVRTVESFTQTYSSPSASNATRLLKLWSGPQIWRSGFFNKALTAAQLDALYGRYKYKLGF